MGFACFALISSIWVSMSLKSPVKESPAVELPLSDLAWDRVAWEWVVGGPGGGSGGKAGGRVMILTAGDREAVLEDNRAAYARRHGMPYVHCACGGGLDAGGKACPAMSSGKWQVYMCMLSLFRHPDARGVEWFVYVDNDVIFLDLSTDPRAWVKRLSGPETWLVFSAEDMASDPRTRHAFNAGVFLARRGDFSKRVFETLLRKRRMFRDPRYGFKDTLVWYGVLEELDAISTNRIKDAAREGQFPARFRHVTVHDPAEFSLAAHQWEAALGSKSEGDGPWIVHFLGKGNRFHWTARAFCRVGWTGKGAYGRRLAEARRGACSMLRFSKQPLIDRALEFVHYLLDY